MNKSLLVISLVLLLFTSASFTDVNKSLADTPKIEPKEFEVIVSEPLTTETTVIEKEVLEKPFIMEISETPLVSHKEFCEEYNMYDGSPLTGFIDDWGFCVPGLVTTETWFTKSPQYVYGTAVFYSPGVMEATAKWRRMYKEAYASGDYVGAVATPSPADIGETIWIRRDGGEWEGPFLVVDCSRRADMYTHIALNQQVVEVDFKTALRWGMVSTSWEVKDKYVQYSVSRYKEPLVEVYYGIEKPFDSFLKENNPIYFSKYWLNHVVEFQREEIELAPWILEFGLNPVWDLRDGKGGRCFTSACNVGIHLDHLKGFPDIS